jgi:hypothetical protein
MLDIDNVLRFVSFFHLDGDICVKYWERSATSSFIEWLGLPRKQAFLFGGKYRIATEIDNTSLEFQLTEDEMKQWLQEHPEFKLGEIKFSNPIKLLKVNEVRAGSKHYSNTQNFIQDYQAEQHGIPLYQREYENIKSEYLPLLMQYYDEEAQVIRIEGDEESILVTKSTPNFQILFADGEIKLRASYGQELARRILNKEELRICHAGMKFKAESFELGNIKIFNDIRANAFVNQVVGYYNEINLQDVVLDVVLQYVALQALSKSNRNLPLEYVFSFLADEIIMSISLSDRLSKVEDDLLEYKSRDILSGGNGRVIDDLAHDLKKKLSKNPCKLYIVGVEDDGAFDPIPASRVQSDRIEIIRKGIQNTLPDIEVFAFSVTQKDHALLFILAM